MSEQKETSDVKRGPGRPKTGRGDWVTLGLQVSPEMAAKLKEIPHGQRGQAVDEALRLLVSGDEADETEAASNV